MTDLAHSGSASIPGGDEAAGATMLEKAARAVQFTAHFYGAEVPAGLAGEIARAVLMAVRELPDEILNEHLYDNEYGYAMYYEGWQPAIDAILADGEGR